VADFLGLYFLSYGGLGESPSRRRLFLISVSLQRDCLFLLKAFSAPLRASSFVSVFRAPIRNPTTNPLSKITHQVVRSSERGGGLGTRGDGLAPPPVCAPDALRVGTLPGLTMGKGAMPSVCGLQGCAKKGCLQASLPGADAFTYYCCRTHMVSAGASQTASNKKQRNAVNMSVKKKTASPRKEYGENSLRFREYTVPEMQSKSATTAFSCKRAPAR
jgi:hypothetical protein